MVDPSDLESGVARRVGSSPTMSTIYLCGVVVKHPSLTRKRREVNAGSIPARGTNILKLINEYSKIVDIYYKTQT